VSGPPPGPLTGAGFLQLQNAQATENLLDALGITSQVRFEIIPAVLPVAIISDVDPTRIDKLAYGTVALVAGGVGDFNHIQIFNPAASGITIHVDSALVSSATTQRVSLRLHDTALTTNSATKGFRDRRIPGNPVGQTRFSDGDSVLGAARISIDIIANTALLVPIDSYLDPGQGVLVANGNSNTTLAVSYYWEEFPRRTAAG